MMIEKLKRLLALAETGIVYHSNNYELERCSEQRDLCLKMIAEVTDNPIEKIRNFYMPPVEYPTPKVDVRAFVLNDRDEVLLVKESEDDKWSIPGGWSDVGFSPAEVAIKELEEETGLDASVDRLLAVWDVNVEKKPDPVCAFYVYKMVFYCRADFSKPLNHAFDIEDAAFFSMDKLPELSHFRINEHQLKILFEMVKKGEIKTLAD
ncbi:MAG: NUDIX hydrolase N-terminal domain-containing protein [Bacteroidales bacterium]|nr:NUDIX hydrolase N-terminal domain-containing protein [Bacteroidales bacterium]